MKNERINYGEFKIFREVFPLIKLRLKKIKNKLLNKKIRNKKKILVVDTCIIGDFLATLPALRTFIKKNHTNVDLIVSPSVKTLAEKIRGVNKVFTAKSSYNRNIEKKAKERKIAKDYGLIAILRISPEAYDLIKNIKNANIIMCDLVYLKYFFHFIKSILFKKDVKQAREVIFEIIGEKYNIKNVKLNGIFKFNKSDYDFIKKIPVMKMDEKKIIIHTGSGWKVRLWQNRKWIELLKKIKNIGKFKFIFIGSENKEKNSFDYIQKNLDFEIFSLIDKVNLKELFIVMKNSDYFIGIDSGPRNLAHLADLRSISLLSPATVKNFMPFDKNDIILEKQNRLPIIFFNTNKKSNLEKITSEEVFDAFKRISKTNKS